MRGPAQTIMAWKPPRFAGSCAATQPLAFAAPVRGSAKSRTLAPGIPEASGRGAGAWSVLPQQARCDPSVAHTVPCQGPGVLEQRILLNPCRCSISKV